MTAATVLHLIETAAKAADCCPHAVYVSRKRSGRGNRAKLARNLVFLRLQRDGYTIPQIAKAFALTPHTVRYCLRSTRLHPKNPITIAVSAALHLHAA